MVNERLSREEKGALMGRLEGIRCQIVNRTDGPIEIPVNGIQTVFPARSARDVAVYEAEGWCRAAVSKTNSSGTQTESFFGIRSQNVDGKHVERDDWPCSRLPYTQASRAHLPRFFSAGDPVYKAAKNGDAHQIGVYDAEGNVCPVPNTAADIQSKEMSDLRLQMLDMQRQFSAVLEKGGK